jgi:hypothetical protein
LGFRRGQGRLNEAVRQAAEAFDRHHRGFDSNREPMALRYQQAESAAAHSQALSAQAAEVPDAWAFLLVGALLPQQLAQRRSTVPAPSAEQA